METDNAGKKVDVDNGLTSLRADGELYIDRTNESHRLIEHIRQSSSSVVAIAGPRGTGKSSLAKKVIEALSRDSYTLVISSPTAFNHLEYVISLFQRLARDVQQRVDAILGQSDSIQARGRRLENSARRTYWALVLGPPTVLAIVGVIVLVSWRSDQDNKALSALRAEQHSLVTQVQLFGRALPDSALRRLEYVTFRIEADSIRAYARSHDFGGLGIRTLELLLALTAVYVLAMSCVLWGLREYRRMKRMSSHPEHAGLREKCVDLLEWLSYSRSSKSGWEVGAEALKATLKGSGERSLEDRPLSLALVTAELAVFLEEVAGVFDGRAVIAIDELDKIATSAEVEGLLNCTKAFLNVKGTHFLFTLSEDVVAPFFVRKGRERGVLESTFDYVETLDRVSLKLGTEIARSRWKGNDNSAPSETNAAIIWAIGGGLPREIARLVLSARLRGLGPESDPPKLWGHLIRNELGDVTMWANLRMRAEQQAQSLESLVRYVRLAERQAGIDSFPTAAEVLVVAREGVKMKLIPSDKAFGAVLAGSAGTDGALAARVTSVLACLLTGVVARKGTGATNSAAWIDLGRIGEDIALSPSGALYSAVAMAEALASA